MAMAKFKDRKTDVLSMAAERAEPEDTKPTLEPVKFSPQPEASTDALAHNLDSTSISSEDFYDAEEAPTVTYTLDTHDGQSASSSNMESDIEEEHDPQGPEDMGAVVSANKSIILHILSQIKVGMDLSRFTLPAFLLAPYSILQMYARLFGRPNMLTEVTDQPTPRDRMIGVTRWFLGSISASRKDTAPKKPYNPVLGETFHCYWNLPDNSGPSSPNSKVLVDTGPFPQGGYDSFSFVAEQVSHHPPVSAFYGECPAKKIYVQATVCSKPRLTPTLAVKAHNTGTFRICLLEHGEEYVTALPHAYVRGILTGPWFEFGGECVVECAKTGHSAKVAFHAKPFRGGKKHRVTTELRHESEKKPYMVIDGEWDNVLYNKTTEKKPEPFLEASVPTYPRKLKKLSAADSTDSRVVWQHLTAAIKADDDQAAADAKHSVEERQREKVKERNKTGEVFELKYFHQSKDDPSVWEYNTPLYERLASLR